MLAKEPTARFPDLDSAIAAFGPPDPARLDVARGQLMSIARKVTERKPRLSVPMSPIPATSRPSVATTVMPTAAPTVIEAKRSPPPTPTKRRSVLPWVLAVVAVLGLGGYFGARKVMADRATPGQNASLQRGIQMWQQGKGEIAELDFQKAARELPRSALPHIYLSRMARERGDLPAAFAEAQRAANLEPNNALALREMGSVLLARGNNEAARRFFLRALRVNPQDQTAMGWLACSLQKLGDAPAAARWAGRAGNGPWSACLR
jgi:cytochrome c-type biogenesis protein CcmH/NrfG